MPPRLILLTTSFPRHADDDAGIFVSRLVQALSNAGTAGQVIVPADATPETLSEVGAFSIKRMRYGLLSRGALAFGAGIVPNLKRNPLLALQIPSLLLVMTVSALRAAQPDSRISAHWTLPGIAAWLVWIVKETPYTITVRGEDFRLLSLPLLGRFLFPALRHARAVITVNQEFRERLIKLTGIPAERIQTIENGCDNFSESQEEGTAEIKQMLPYLLFIGTVIPRKRIEILLEMLIVPELQEYRLIICGRTEDAATYATLESAVKARQLSDRVHFAGAVAPRTIARYLHHATAYVSASEFEGRPNAVLEALAAGKVVMVSDIPAHREIISEGENGLLFSTDDISEAARRLKQVLGDGELMQKLGVAAQRGVEEYTWKRCAERYLALLAR